MANQECAQQVRDTQLMHITHLLCVSTIMGTPVLAADIWYHISLLHPNTIACNELQLLLLPLWEHPYHLYIEHGKSSVCTTRPHKHTCTYVSVCLSTEKQFLLSSFTLLFLQYVSKDCSSSNVHYRNTSYICISCILIVGCVQPVVLSNL